jgi:hypothetical protein
MAPMHKSSRKRVKFYSVPSQNATSRIRHTTFSASAGKVSTRTNFVNVPNVFAPTIPPLIRTTASNDQDDLMFSVGDVHDPIPIHDKIDARDELFSSWMSERNRYLAEMVMMEGRGDAIYQEHCPQCGTNQADYRCLDCFGEDLYCSSCLVSAHRHIPFHVIEVISILLISNGGL